MSLCGQCKPVENCQTSALCRLDGNLVANTPAAKSWNGIMLLVPGVTGDPGTVSGGSCQVGGRCDTEKFVQDVNLLSPPLCGYTDWRMPTADELLGLVHYGGVAPLIDSTYFPSASGNAYWSGSPSARSQARNTDPLPPSPMAAPPGPFSM